MTGTTKKLQLLLNRTDIPVSIINEVVAQATLEFHPEILQTLGTDSRLTPEVRCAAFAKAINKRNLHAARALFQENQISSQEVTRAFVRAACAGDLRLVKFLQGKPAIDVSAEQDAVLAAARANRDKVTRHLLKRRERSIETLQEALSATRNESLQMFLRACIAQRQDGSSRAER
ncbi:hypothetical protein PHYSODRAFT_301196 [Phytophthora sojae]|uniref:DUF4116 domain-containing protein n=1 Tax=Phytophthora sojae (strain P6497) TaxID=1094619 RepID=G4ZGZ0_PHYSP|nr:hypothetical protein PHYSODRAFT_301196 [Phytophthora sojae]EGZ18615.1 hypothetical protein PHYSODRAFT_301196 [Phytophthora sojae]|eukprot:XP_009527673.1 hypothetical protein PHYSODRAFT_301196 [Phytophthora sojae]